MSKAYGVIDSLALEWFREDGPIATSLREDGYDNLPGAPDIWHVGILPKGVFIAGPGSMADFRPPDASGGNPTDKGQVELFKGVRYGRCGFAHPHPWWLLRVGLRNVWV